MKKFFLILLAILAACIAFWLVLAGAEAATAAWPFFAEINPPAKLPGRYDLAVPLQVMDRSRDDLADLRLYDGGGKELPYALRIRREIEEQREIVARVFNQVEIGSKATEVSVDLGENPAEHNQIDIATTGSNFRRRVDVEGGDSGKDWRTISRGELIFSFESQNGLVESSSVNYPTSRYRYVRLRVFPDPAADKEAPVVSAVKVMMVVRTTGESASWPAGMTQQFVRSGGAPASAWTIDLGGRVPCERLLLEINDDSFSRPFQIEVADDPQNLRWVAAGELRRRVGEPRRPLVVAFDHEERARKLRLLVTDYSNQALSISTITAAAPTRQVIFDLKAEDTLPLRLFFGNLKSTAPHYDFEKELPATLSRAPIRIQVGDLIGNPAYIPQPLPLTERLPWLIYVVLAASSLALGFILFSLIRTAVKTGPPHKEQSPPEGL